MKGITRCLADTCPYRDTCYRYKKQSKTDDDETGIDFSRGCNESTGFDSYMPMMRE